jgi:hypothetical protein
MEAILRDEYLQGQIDAYTAILNGWNMGAVPHRQAAALRERAEDEQQELRLAHSTD